MIKINPTTNIATFRPTFKDNSHENNQKNRMPSAIATAAAGTVVIGSTILIGKNKMSIRNYEDALKKCGVEIKNGIAIVTATGEKYTGVIKRNLSINKKETINFVNGKMNERLYHNMLGRELEGEFYKDGVLTLNVGKHQGFIYKSFPFRRYEDGNIVSRGDVLNQRVNSVFDWARNLLKN